MSCCDLTHASTCDATASIPPAASPAPPPCPSCPHQTAAARPAPPPPAPPSRAAQDGPAQGRVWCPQPGQTAGHRDTHTHRDRHIVRPVTTAGGMVRHWHRWLKLSGLWAAWASAAAWKRLAVTQHLSRNTAVQTHALLDAGRTDTITAIAMQLGSWLYLHPTLTFFLCFLLPEPCGSASASAGRLVPLAPRAGPCASPSSSAPSLPPAVKFDEEASSRAPMLASR